MKRVLGLLVAVCFGAALGRMFDGRPAAAAAGGGGVPLGNGDVNGDGTYDVSDAVYYLNWRFLGGPAPVPIEPQPAKESLPDTGQTTCYGTDGSVIPCNSANCPGQDGSYATGCPSEGRFTDNGDGTVTDHCTGLMWQKDTADTNGDGVSNDQDYLRWCEALTYCENLSFAGHDDWRLPNVRELQSIVDYGRFNPSIDPVFGALSSYYWSSTSIASVPDGAWYVSFDDGYVISVDKGSHYYVRAVRSGP